MLEQVVMCGLWGFTHAFIYYYIYTHRGCGENSWWNVQNNNKRYFKWLSPFSTCFYWLLYFYFLVSNILKTDFTLYSNEWTGNYDETYCEG